MKSSPPLLETSVPALDSLSLQETLLPQELIYCQSHKKEKYKKYFYALSYKIIINVSIATCNIVSVTS